MPANKRRNKGLSDTPAEGNGKSLNNIASRDCTGNKTDRSKTKKHSEKSETRMNDILWWIAVVICAVTAAGVHRDHIFKLFENDKHFSHLSNLEREMAFRTELGLYYSYFKTIIHAPSFLDGLHQVTHDNLTEYPDTINTLKRFNLYPEVVLGLGFRIYDSVAKSFQMRTKLCWQVNRGEGLSPVQSCEGLGEPTYFYVHAVMNLNGLMMGIYFLFGTFLSKSILGGMITVAAYFFNHGECTRVMWTPPLRESFAFPILIMEMFWLSYMLRLNKPTLKHSMILALGIISFMLPWQFAQFALMTQLIAVLGCYVLLFINHSKMKKILIGHSIGLLCSFLLLFGNLMLLTSFYASCILSIWVLLALEHILAKLKFRPLIVIMQGVILLIGMISIKIILGKVLGVEDDAHIGDILKSKFGNFQTFDTLLYTCAKEFDFLETSTYVKLFYSLLIPSAMVASFGVAVLLVVREYLNWERNEQNGIIKGEQVGDGREHSEVLYNVFQMVAFVGMAVIIMRLKLFATPQLCLISSLIASRDFFGFYYIINNIKWHRALVIALLAGMAMQGIGNIKHQLSIQGEYSNYPMEELIEWILKETPPDGAFGGPMPTMANIKLSTGRPIVNHPHYEDAGLRARTKQIYTLASRKPIQEVHKICKNLKVSYIVYEGGWCLRSGAKTGCTMPEIWDVEDPSNRHNPPLCATIMRKSEPYFKKVYHNVKFDVFKVL